ncbi:MAG: DUF835 domain-containing protein [Candidatus Diapherotrites archaeon]|uniref:DUF835 domain-containing protein n=1 Tax=Candidatus Iainarchaeum sp. TaxID=3101447 RepID=A0A8T5GEW2_9ARCH|nr:DUF835 domain-containing protein [Candidatus Diapherotrites archaeon]
MAIEYIHLILLGTSLIASIFLALVVLSKKLKSLASLYYFFFMCAISVHIAGDLFFQLSTTVRDALFWIYVYWVGFFFLAMFFFYFATTFPKRKKLFFTNEPAKLILMIIPLGLIYILIYSGEFVKEIVFSQTQITSVIYGNLYWMGTTYLAIFMGLGLIKLFIDYKQASFESEKKTLQLVFIGIFIAAFFGMLGDIFLIRLLGFGELKLASVFMFISCVVMSYVVIKHKIFTITPVTEGFSKEKPIFSAELGRTYFIDEKSKSRKKALRLFSDLVRHNRQGLLVSIDHPNQIRQKYQLEKTPVVWLSDSIEMKKNSIKPNEIEALNNTIHLFLERANMAVVAIDGIEKLIVVNGSRKVINFFDSLMKKSIETNSTIFFSVSDTEKEFVKIYTETIAIKKTLNDLESKLLSRKISNEAYSEILIENWEELIEKEAELKIFEEETIGKISDESPIKHQLFIEQKALTIANYYIAKRKIDTHEGNEIVNNINKKIIRLEKEIRKDQNSY